MLRQLTISKEPPASPELDQKKLQDLGMEHVRQLARALWTDHNVHDPGVTTLELLCYALTDIGYRANLPIEDILASDGDNAAAMREQFFTAREVLPCRPLTELDYRKLLIDLVGVRNAWLRPEQPTLYVDLLNGRLQPRSTGRPEERTFQVKGLYKVLVDLEDGADQNAVVAAVEARLRANRNLCEDFLFPVEVVQADPFILCCELLLDPRADVSAVQARVLFAVEEYLSPPVRSRSLERMLARVRPDKSRSTVAEIFEGPRLDHGFIDDEELHASALREEIYLSDVISIIMDIDGVLAVRDILVNHAGASTPVADRWRIPVAARRRPTLDRARCRIVCYKGSAPVTPTRDVEVEYQGLEREALAAVETPSAEDIPIPLGSFRHLKRYYSVQNHFPVTYGLSEQGVPGREDEARKALAFQLKAYLLFFDQIMADDCAQLDRVRDLFRVKNVSATLEHTYFRQPVDSFRDAERIYRSATPQTDLDALDDANDEIERRGRFADHLLARFAERFHDYVAVDARLQTPLEILRTKYRFLEEYPALSAERGLGRDLTSPWQGGAYASVSGYERRVRRLLGMVDAPGPDGERMVLVENILLRLAGFAGPLLPVCVDPTCTGCEEDDPYSYRVHVLVSAEVGRFTKVSFRRYAEEVIRQEMPAHILPKVCWASTEDLNAVEKALLAWSLAPGRDTLTSLITALYEVKSVYPRGYLSNCDPEEPAAGGAAPPRTERKPHFILDQTQLGGLHVPNEEPEESPGDTTNRSRDNG